MATFVLLNMTRTIAKMWYAGTIVDDTLIDTSEIVANGGHFWPTGDPLVDAAAAVCARERNRGNCDRLDEIMQSGLDASINSKNTNTNVDTIAALQGLTYTSAIAVVRGYTASGDGGHGSFFWDTASTQAPIPGLVVQQTGSTGPGRFIRSGDRSTVHASWYGGDLIVAHGAAATIGAALELDPGVVYSLPTNVTLTASQTIKFNHGAKITGDGTIIVQAGYEAGRHKVFDDALTVQIQAMHQGEMLPEHFGAQVLTDPRVQNGQTPFDSTSAFQRMFKSISSLYYPVPSGSTPGGYAPALIRLTGWYGISDEIKVSGGAGMTILGNGIGLTGSGLRWIGPDVVGNASKAMLRFYGPMFALLEGFQLIGLPTTTDANRLLAAICFEANGTPPAPFYGENGRRSTVRRVQIGDDTGIFNVNPALGNFFQRGFTTAGSNSNDDFHELDNVIIDRADDSVAIANDQNVYITLRKIGAGRFKNSALWLCQGTAVTLDGFYYYNAGAGSTAIRLSPLSNSDNIRINAKDIGGEGNNNIAGFIACSDSAAQFFMNLDGCEIEQLEGKPFFVGSNPNFVITATDSQISGDFIQSNNSPGARAVLNLIGCRGLSNIRVQNATGYGTLKVNVKGCWANTYSAAPTDLQNAGHYLGHLDGDHVFTGLNAGSLVSLGDASLYGRTSLDCDIVGYGQPAFGIESTLGNRAWQISTGAARVNTLVGVVPAKSYVDGVIVFTPSANFVNCHTLASGGLFIGDGTTVDKYGKLSAAAGFTESTVTSGYAPTLQDAAQDVVLTAYYLLGSYSWSGNTLTGSGFDASMVGTTFRMKDGSIAGQTATVTAYVSPTQLTLSASQTGTGTGYFDAQFFAGQSLVVVPIYRQTFSSGFLWPSITEVQSHAVTTSA